MGNLKLKLGPRAASTPPVTPLSITGSPATTATVGTPYSFTPTLAGGVPPYSVTLNAGTLPAGLSLNATTGAITGTPTTAETKTGLVLRLADSVGTTPADLAAFQILVSAGSDIVADFGTKTRSGYGGVPSGNAPASSITGLGASDWVVDALGDIVPSGTYAAFKTFTRSSYSLTLANGSVVAITMVANAAHIKFLATDTDSTQQLRVLLALAGGTSGAIAIGDTIWVRDSNMANTSIWGIRPPAPINGSWTDPATLPGKVTVRSVTAGTGFDAYGPTLEHGAKFRGLNVNPAVSGAIYFPLEFKQVWFYPSFTGATLRYSSTTDGGWGISFDECKFSPDGSPNDLIEALWLAGGTGTPPTYFTNCRMDQMGKGCTLTSTISGGVAEGTTCTGNIFVDMLDDAFAIGSASGSLPGNQNMVFERNFCIGGSVLGASHPDFIQSQGNKTGVSLVFGRVFGNIYISNGVSNAFQPYFFSDSTDPGRNLGLEFTCNIGTTTAAQGLNITLFDNPQAKYNAILSDLNPLGNETAIRVPDSLGGTDATVTYNLLSAAPVLLPQQGGTVVSTPNAVLAKTVGAYQVAMPNWSASGLTDRASVLLAYTPANTLVSSGGVMETDGRCNGPLFPAVSGETIGAWNDGSVFEPLNPTWVLAHPPAT